MKTKTSKKDSGVATRVKRTAELCGVTPRQVYRVIQGEQVNESVLRVYMQLFEGENLLLAAVKQAVPFE